MRQNVAAEHMAQAELEIADNVEMEEDGTWIKREGLSRVTPTRDSGTWTAGGDGAAFDGVGVAATDGDQRCWELTGTVYRNRGLYPRGYDQSLIRAPIARAIRTTTLQVGDNTWIITQTVFGWTIEIVLTATGARVTAPFFGTVTGIDALAAASDGSFVWIFSTTDGTSIICDKISISTPTAAPVQTTYLTTAGAFWQSIDAFFLPSLEIVVVASGIGAATAKYVHSYLDPATGAARASPAPVIVSNATIADFVGPAGSDDIQNSISVLSGVTAPTFFYAVWDQNTLKLVEVTATTLAAAATTTLQTVTSTTTAAFRGVASGLVQTGGAWQVFSAFGQTITGSTINPNLTRFDKDGGSFTTSPMNRAYWPLSRPALYVTKWFLAVQYERFRGGDTAAFIQQTIYVINTDGHILSRVVPGQVRANTNTDEVWPTTAHSFVDSTSTYWITAGLADVTDGSTRSASPYNPILIRLRPNLGFGTPEFLYGRPVKYARGKVCIPAGIPGMFGAEDRARSLTPLMFPTKVAASLGSGASLSGETGVAVVYRFVDADGTITRSSPTIAAFTFTDAGTRTVTVDTLRVGHASLIDNATFGDPLANTIENRVEIEFYLTEVGLSDLRLYDTVSNDPTVETVTVSVGDATALSYKSDEFLYTTGGRLSNAVAPQTRAAAFWKERLHLASDDFVYSSGEARFGFGPDFSEFKRRRFLGEPIIALCPIDWNYLGAFKEVGIAALSGPGPDGRGAGNYEIHELNTLKGVVRPRSIVQSIHGAHFQDSQDGQQCLVTSQLQIAEVGDGVFDRRSSLVKDCAHVESLRQVWFLLSDRILVLDYEHVTEDQPFGRWSEWKGTGIGSAAGEMIAVPASGPLIIISNSSGIYRQRKPGVYTDDTATSPAAYEQLLQTGEFPFAGFGGEYDIQELLGLLENVSGGTLAVEVTLSSDRAEKTAGPETFSLATTRRRLHWKPGGQTRVGGTKIKISDASSATAGYRLVAMILQIAAENHGKFPRIADRS